MTSLKTLKLRWCTKKWSMRQNETQTYHCVMDHFATNAIHMLLPVLLSATAGFRQWACAPPPKRVALCKRQDHRAEQIVDLKRNHGILSINIYIYVFPTMCPLCLSCVFLGDVPLNNPLILQAIHSYIQALQSTYIMWFSPPYWA